MIAFIDAHRDAYGVEPMCRVLPIAPSTYHAHRARSADPRRLSARAGRDEDLKVRIRRVFEENFQVYGVRKIWRQLGREGVAVARCTVERLMRIMGLEGAIRGRPVRTTRPDRTVCIGFRIWPPESRFLNGLRRRSVSKVVADAQPTAVRSRSSPRPSAPPSSA